MGEVLEAFVKLMDGDEDMLSLDKILTKEEKAEWEILDKIFSIYCRDEFGNIVLKNEKNYLDYLLLDFNDSEEIDNNCDNTNVFNSNPENFLTYLKLFICMTS